MPEEANRLSGIRGRGGRGDAGLYHPRGGEARLANDRQGRAVPDVQRNLRGKSHVIRIQRQLGRGNGLLTKVGLMMRLGVVPAPKA